MKGHDVLFSHKSDHWSTPKDLYNRLDDEFGFDYDPCPLRGKKDGLDSNWNGVAFCNPPYSNSRAFIEKAISEIKKGRCKLAVFLLPARTDTSWFHDLIYNNYEIRFIRGRLKFGNSKNSAPFPSMIVIIR